MSCYSLDLSHPLHFVFYINGYSLTTCFPPSVISTGSIHIDILRPSLFTWEPWKWTGPMPHFLHAAPTQGLRIAGVLMPLHCCKMKCDGGSSNGQLLLSLAIQSLLPSTHFFPGEGLHLTCRLSPHSPAPSLFIVQAFPSVITLQIWAHLRGCFSKDPNKHNSF